MEAYNTIPILIYGLNSAVPAYVFTHSMKMVFFSKAYFITPSAKKAIDCAHVESLQRYYLLYTHVYPYIFVFQIVKIRSSRPRQASPSQMKPSLMAF